MITDRFVAKYAESVYPLFVKAPNSEDEFRNCERENAQAGLNGMAALLIYTYIYM